MLGLNMNYYLIIRGPLGCGKTTISKELAKKLKEKLACGGTVKDGIIELQGNHVSHVKQELIKLGFSSESIKTIG